MTPPKPYQPLENLAPEERMMMLAGRTKDATEAMIRRLPNVGVYGLLMTSDPEDSLSQVVRKRWAELHHRSGDHVLLLGFNPPDTWAEALLDDWRSQLGDAFDTTWADWQRGYGLEAGAALGYLDFVTGPEVKATDLPCIVLFTDLEGKKAVVRPLPDWPPDELFDLLGAMIDVMVECVAIVPAEERLERLRATLTSPSKRARVSLRHVFDRAAGYLREHPAVVASTTVSLIIALATANVLPLSAGVLAILNEAKDTLKS